ncbi:flagellar basal body P-ring formation chaperone FlgA [uncultured Xylophilus sp.]|uniref:flagellar basal body P-ring formation chaperone FlgA n=1 Tax=uncultured Xylophilus sp. TaxID=296832 RepID=UPI0025E86628|nr:flagellar basal body P-ring formation chaperone FlgA [uncultured Xylophilus sp.]
MLLRFHRPSFLSRSRSWLGVWTAAGLLAAAGPASAQAVALEVGADVLESSRRWVDEEVYKAQATAGGQMPLRMEVTVGSLDSRLRLAPCTKVEPYIPVGMRLWGKTRLGLRCVEGQTRWNVFLPIQVKAFGPAWVVRGPVVAGATLSANDAMQAEVDWADEASPVLADASQWVGAVLTRSLNAGQALRQSAVRAATAFQAGAQVRIVAQGTGFAVTSDGQAVSAGVVGQPVRVRMEGGRMMTGTVLDARTVRLDI